MDSDSVSAYGPYGLQRVAVLDSEMAYIDTGTGFPIVFLHGNPTSSYLWRNVIPHVAGVGRCLAPDLVGMGDSGRNPGGSYRFVDHARYLDALFDALEINEDVTLVNKSVQAELRELDYAEALSRLSFQTVILEAAQQSYVKISGLNLFNAMR